MYDANDGPEMLVICYGRIYDSKFIALLPIDHEMNSF